MGHHKKSSCKPCEEKKQHHGKRDDKSCGRCKEPKCDCRCQDEKEEAPLAVVEANFAPSTQPGVIASAVVPLSDNPQYRPEWNVCERREVVTRINTTLLGGSTPQTVQARIGVFYDTAPNQVFYIKTSAPFSVPAGQTVQYVTTLKTDLDKDRILFVELIYFSGETPPPGAAVTYIAPIAPATDIRVSLFYSKKYPARHDDDDRKHHH